MALYSDSLFVLIQNAGGGQVDMQEMIQEEDDEKLVDDEDEESTTQVKSVSDPVQVKFQEPLASKSNYSLNVLKIFKYNYNTSNCLHQKCVVKCYGKRTVLTYIPLTFMGDIFFYPLNCKNLIS